MEDDQHHKLKKKDTSSLLKEKCIDRSKLASNINSIQVKTYGMNWCYMWPLERLLPFPHYQHSLIPHSLVEGYYIFVVLHVYPLHTSCCMNYMDPSYSIFRLLDLYDSTLRSFYALEAQFILTKRTMN